MFVKKTIKILLYVLLTSGLLLTGLQLSFLFYYNDRIRHDLQNEVSRLTHGEYELRISSINTNLFLQSVYAKGFLLIPSRKVNALAPKVYLSAEAMDLENFEIMPFLLKRNLIFSNMDLLHPQALVYRGDARHEKPKDSKPFELYSLFRKYGRALYVDRIKISNSDLRFYDSLGAPAPFVASRDNGLFISGLFINGGLVRKGRAYSAEKVDLDMRNFSFVSANKRYTVTVKKLWASYYDSILIVDSIQLIPNFPPGQFEKMAGKQVDIFSGDLAKLSFRGMDLKQFMERNAFIAQEMEMDRMNVRAYRDKNIARVETIQPSLQQLIRNIPFYINIAWSHFHAVNLAYEEVPEGFTETETVTLSNMTGSMKGFSNDLDLIAGDNMLKFQGTGWFMNKGYGTVYLDFPLNTTASEFHCKGSIVKMPFETFNPIVGKTASIRIKKGFIEAMNFEFDANDKEAVGEMLLLYRGLKVEVLDKKSEKAEKLKTFVANAFVIIDDNPMGNEAPRISPIHYERDPTRFIFSYTLNAIISGIKPAVGMNKEIRQQDRSGSKEERKAKRKERREKRRIKQNENPQG